MPSPCARPRRPRSPRIRVNGSRATVHVSHTIASFSSRSNPCIQHLWSVGLLGGAVAANAALVTREGSSSPRPWVVTFSGSPPIESFDRGIGEGPVRTMYATSNAHGGAATPEQLEESRRGYARRRVAELR